MRDSIRTVKNFPIDGIHFRDITGLLEDPNAFKESIMLLTSACIEFNCNTIIGIESRGFIFGAPIAFDLDLPLVLARKPGKLPNDKKDYELEYGSTSLEIQTITNITKNDKVVIIDDLIATGGTAIACADLIHENFNVPKDNILILAVIDLTDLGGFTRIVEQGYNAGALIEFQGE